MAAGALAFVLVENASLEIRLSGAWTLRGGLPQAASLQRELDLAPQVKTVAFETAGLVAWDSSVIAFLAEVAELARMRRVRKSVFATPRGEALARRQAPRYLRRRSARDTVSSRSDS